MLSFIVIFIAVMLLCLTSISIIFLVIFNNIQKKQINELTEDIMLLKEYIFIDINNIDRKYKKILEGLLDSIEDSNNKIVNFSDDPFLDAYKKSLDLFTQNKK